MQKAVDEGVRLGYEEGFLRKSVVRDPLDRVNTGDNTPAMLYVNLVPGEQVTVTVAPKGFGSENMSRIKMLKPSDGLEAESGRFKDEIVPIEVKKKKETIVVDTDEGPRPGTTLEGLARLRPAFKIGRAHV